MKFVFECDASVLNTILKGLDLLPHGESKAVYRALEAGAQKQIEAAKLQAEETPQKLSADRMEIARLRDEVRKQKPQLAALMELMEAELPADKG